MKEKERVQHSRDLKTRLERLRHEIELAQQSGDYARASELQYSDLPELEAQLAGEDVWSTMLSPRMGWHESMS